MQQMGGENPMKAFQEAVKPTAQENTEEESKRLAEMLKNVVEKKQNFLNELPEDAGGRVKQLQEYEFMDPEAAARFQELMQMLKQTLMDGFFKDLTQQIAGLDARERPAPASAPLSGRRRSRFSPYLFERRTKMPSERTSGKT